MCFNVYKYRVFEKIHRLFLEKIQAAFGENNKQTLPPNLDDQSKLAHLLINV